MVPVLTSAHRWHCDRDPHDAQTPIWHTHKSSDEIVACVPEKMFWVCVFVSVKLSRCLTEINLENTLQMLMKAMCLWHRLTGWTLAVMSLWGRTCRVCFQWFSQQLLFSFYKICILRSIWSRVNAHIYMSGTQSFWYLQRKWTVQTKMTILSSFTYPLVLRKPPSCQISFTLLHIQASTSRSKKNTAFKVLLCDFWSLTAFVSICFHCKRAA